jgi:hypothetical protein
MDLRIDEYERDLLIESLEFRVESDGDLVISESLKEDLQDLIRKLEDEEY